MIKPSPSREEIRKELEALLSRISARKVSIVETTSIYRDLAIGGDDAGDLIEGIHGKFGTRFDGFKYDVYFPNETDALFDHLASIFGFRNKKKRNLLVGHLLDVIQCGAWFEPH